MTAITDNVEPRLHFFDAPNPFGDAGSHRLAFYEWGNPYAPVIMCLHGLTRNARDFDFLAPALTEHYRVIAVDIPGRGKSGEFARSEWYDNSVYMQDILHLTEHLNIPRFDWIGTSMGGLIGMLIASLVPDKITRLVLNDIGAMLPKEGLLRIASYVGIQHCFANRGAAENALRLIMAPFGIREESHWQHVFRHSLVENKDGTVSLAYDPAIADNFKKLAGDMGEITDIELWMLWEEVNCPALILRGAESDILPRTVAEKMIAVHEGVTLVEFAGIGHAPTLMEQDQITAITRWLDKHPLHGI